MDYYNNTLVITGAELIKSSENQDGILSKPMYDKLIRDGRVRVVKRGCYTSPSLIDYQSIPERYKHQLREIGVKADTAKSVLEQMVDVDFEAREFYAAYTLADGRRLPEDKQREYINNAEVCNAIMNVISDTTLLRRALGGSTNNIWPPMAERVASLASVSHTLPANYRRLRDKVEQYRRGSYESLISGKWLNANAKKVVDREQEATLRQLIRKHNNFDNEQIRELYNIAGGKLGWESISTSTVANYRKRWSLETYGGQRGETAFDNTKAMLVKRRAPALPLVYWTVDGWDVELLYQRTEIDQSGNSRTTYHNRLTVVIVLDPCGKYPIGFAIGTHETPALIKEALRNAVNHTLELFGTRHKVLQLQTDNYGRKGLTPFYQAISDYFTPAKAHNAKAKVIEPYFKRLNKKYCQLMPNWSGFGITANKKSQPSGDYLNKIRHSFPDETGCRYQIERIIELERASAIDKYMHAYSELPEADKRQLSASDYLYLLGETTGFTNKISASGLVATVQGTKREYDTFDASFRKMAHVDWTLKFDPNTPETVLAVNGDGTTRFLLSEKYEQPMALRDRADNDSEQLQLVRNFNKNLKANIMRGMGDDCALVDSMFASNPQLKDTLSKFVLVDSNGQHKDNKSASRLGSKAQSLIEKNTKESDSQDSENWGELQKDYLNQKVDINKYL